MPALSGIVALICVAASWRRLIVAVAPTSLDPEVLRGALVNVEAQRRLGDTIGAWREDCWERGLFAAFSEPDPGMRAALVDEHLTELDRLASRWSRVPRVCASIATSSGFLFALVSILGAWAGGPTLPVGQALAPSLDAFGLGVMAAAFCVVVHGRARRAEKGAVGAVHRFVDEMRLLAGSQEETRRAF
jgi:hypothetical protein